MSLLRRRNLKTDVPWGQTPRVFRKKSAKESGFNFSHCCVPQFPHLSPGQMAPVQHALLLKLIFASVASGLDNCITVTSIKDYSLIGHAYRTSSGKSLMTCIISCDQDAHCYSLNYRFAANTCELNNATRYSNLQEFMFSPDTVYFDHPTRPSGSCLADWPCKNMGKCVNVARAPGYRCECQHDYIGDTCNGNTSS